MDLLQIVSDARSVVTLICMTTFVGIVIWAYSARRAQDFEEAAMLPFADEEPLTKEQESRHG
jgi:cytochrome c oxidase cbb3-type subunit 4